MNVDPFRAWQGTWGVLGLAAGALVVATHRPLALLELLFLVWFIGFLVGVELWAPRHEAPDRWPWVRWVLLAGLVVAVVVAARRALAVL